MRRFIKNQRGQSVILLALLLPVLCGLIGLGIDLGYLIMQKVQMQNTVDLTALSAVQKVKESHGAVESTAIHIARKNGVMSNELTIVHPYKDDYYKVEIKATRVVKVFFLQFLGIQSKEVKVHAVAQLKSTTSTGISDQALDYAVFHGNSTTDLQIKGNSSIVNGNVHSNKKVAIQGANHKINGNVSAVDGISGDMSGITGTISGKDVATLIPMPNLNFDDYVSKADKVYTSSQTFNNLNISGIWYINGDVTISGSRVTGKGILLASGNIKIAGSGIEYSTSDDLLALFSKGNIQIASSGGKIQGVLYAPNGQIQISGSGNTFYGALIGKEVVWSTKDITINGNYDIRTPEAFTTTVDEILLTE